MRERQLRKLYREATANYRQGKHDAETMKRSEVAEPDETEQLEYGMGGTWHQRAVDLAYREGRQYAGTNHYAMPIEVWAHVLAEAHRR